MCWSLEKHLSLVLQSDVRKTRVHEMRRICDMLIDVCGGPRGGKGGASTARKPDTGTKHRNDAINRRDEPIHSKYHMPFLMTWGDSRRRLSFGDEHHDERIDFHHAASDTGDHERTVIQGEGDELVRCASDALIEFVPLLCQCVWRSIGKRREYRDEEQGWLVETYQQHQQKEAQKRECPQFGESVEKKRLQDSVIRAMEAVDEEMEVAFDMLLLMCLVCCAGGQVPDIDTGLVRAVVEEIDATCTQVEEYCVGADVIEAGLNLLVQLQHQSDVLYVSLLRAPFRVMDVLLHVCKLHRIPENTAMAAAMTMNMMLTHPSDGIQRGFVDHNNDQVSRAMQEARDCMERRLSVEAFRLATSMVPLEDAVGLDRVASALAMLLACTE